MTLIELLVAMVVSSTVLAALGGALMILLRTPPETVNQLTSSGSAFQTGSTFADDIESAGPESGQLAVTRNTPGCGTGPPSVVRVVSSEGGDTQVRSYSVGVAGTTLERRVCSGATQADALLANASASTVVNDLDPTKAPVVNCRASAVASPAPVTTEGDAECRLVSMTVTTSTNLVFTVEGRRNTVQTPLKSTAPTKQQCTLGGLRGIADTYVSQGGSERYWNYGDDTEFVVQHGNNGLRKNAYLKANLLTGCTGTNEPRFMPGGEQLDSATLSLPLQQPDPAANASTDDHFRLVTLPDWYAWNEDTLTYDDLAHCSVKPTPQNQNPFSFPCETDPASDASKFNTFQIGVGTYPRQIDVDVLIAVRGWYDGSVPNRGWSLDRGFNNPVDGNNIQYGGWRFGSKDNTNAQPKLIVTWK